MFNNTFFKLSLISIIITLLLNCGSSNRLNEYQFREQSAAASLAPPPPPEVFTDTFPFIDETDPIGTLLNVGTTIVKEVELAKVAAKMDSAIENVDVPQLIVDRTLYHCAEFMRFNPVSNSADTDFLFNFFIRNYGIEAKSWNAATYFKMEVDIMLLDNQTDLLIWKKRIKERNRISAQIFGAGTAIGNVITAVTLSKLSVQQIKDGLGNLADFTSDKISRKLYQDYIKSREVD
jgi:hypothetical protein